MTLIDIEGHDIWIYSGMKSIWNINGLSSKKWNILSFLGHKESLHVYNTSQPMMDSAPGLDEMFGKWLAKMFAIHMSCLLWSFDFAWNRETVSLVQLYTGDQRYINTFRKEFLQQWRMTMANARSMLFPMTMTAGAPRSARSCCLSCFHTAYCVLLLVPLNGGTTQPVEIQS